MDTREQYERRRRQHPAPQWMRDRILLLDGTWTAGVKIPAEKLYQEVKTRMENLKGFEKLSIKQGALSRRIFGKQQVRVPFPLQSELSGWTGLAPDHMCYEREFTIPESFTEKRILLHFGAVDQVAAVYVNEIPVGSHEGGYLAFAFDITKAVKRDGVNRLRVDVTDTLSHRYPYGKQRYWRGGMWYTPVSGIWKSVWLENVPDRYIKKAKMTPDLEKIRVSLTLDGERDRGEASEKRGRKLRSGITGQLAERLQKEKSQSLPKEKILVEIRLTETKVVRRSFEEPEFILDLSRIFREEELGSPRLWTPEDPWLYDITFICGRDRVVTYSALREISIEKRKRVNRVCLNHQPVFLHGVLDQGYFKKGIFTPESNEEYDRDLRNLKELGFNFVRKHIKVEPEYFYYAADRLGILVMQDMVNSGPYEYFSETIIPNLTFKRRPDTFFHNVDRTRKDFFLRHCRETVEEVYNHPSVVAYTIFNEGWGQFESDHAYELMKKWDGTRLIDSTSGWFAQKKSDFDSEHIYFHNEYLKPKKRPLLLSECGGYAYPVEGHLWHPKKSMGYGNASSKKELTDKILLMYQEMVFPSIGDGMCGVVYTQAYDVEEEINGLYTYDREICKVERDRMLELSGKLKEVLEVHLGTVPA